MSDAVEAYEPVNTLKPVDTDIWIVDGPVITFKKLPFPTRMTIVRLASGDLFVHSPTELTEPLKAEIDALGPVRHLVSPNKIHYWWIGAWGDVYPNAIKWASPGARPAAEKQGWRFDRDLGADPDATWADDIDQFIVRGSRVLPEVIFFHKRSRCLILADLIENFEPSKVRSVFLRTLFKLVGIADPNGGMPFDLRLTDWGRRDAIAAAVGRMIAWNPQRIILSHGRWYPDNGVAELRRAFRWIGGIDGTAS